MARRTGDTKAEWLAKEVAKAVNAGKAWELETVDFSDPNRPLTCLEVDFPIVPINDIAIIEGKGSGALKPVYQTMKWWARRRSTVFRSILLAAAIKSPEERSKAAKHVWDVYYGNHQKKGAFKNLRVADIFMGGGTTLIEGARLGMQLYGNDLNPIAWLVVKNELARLDESVLQKELDKIEADVKSQIIQFFTCDCPRGHQGVWTRVNDGVRMPSSFDVHSVQPEQRSQYSYAGPEIIYTFWAKHGPCPVTECGHRTPVMTSPVVASKTISVKYWVHVCTHCAKKYDIEEYDARLAPGVPFVINDDVSSFSVAKLRVAKRGKVPDSTVCPHCKKLEQFGVMGRHKTKRVELTLLVHPDWLRGEASNDEAGRPYGGSAEDDFESTAIWNRVRASNSRLIEVRGRLPEEVTCPETGITIKPNSQGGTVPGKSQLTCQADTCGQTSDIREAINASHKTGPIAMYAIQGYCSICEKEGQPLRGRFYAPADDATNYDAAIREWGHRRNTDLRGYWPTCEVPQGLKVRELHNYHFSHWWKMFNPRQLLVHSLLLKAISSSIDTQYGECILGAFQQYLRNQNMFCFWNMQRALEPFFSNHNYHPKATTVENTVFSGLGRGDWKSCTRFLFESLDWNHKPWEIVSKNSIIDTDVADAVSTSSVKISTLDPVYGTTSPQIDCGSSTELASIESAKFDLVITDPPFESNIQYAELADFFYAWIQLVLKDKYPVMFSIGESPKALEAVANSARHRNDENYYQRLLTACYKEAARILKPGGILAFTFHHNSDDAWVSVLESLFDSGFYLEATYPIRSDETKGDKAQFGSQKIEYDIIHVCRKRTTSSMAISWAKLRRLILKDVRELEELLIHHSKEGLAEADLQVIRRGKALEYFSRHYGKVYKDEGVPINVLEALVGINQLLDEEAGGIKEPPPHNAEPFTRMFLRMFDGKAEIARDQIQKYLRGTGSAPSDFVNRGWCTEKNKIFYITPHLEIAQSWQGRHRKGMTSDYDQAAFLIGACFDGSGINANETLNNENFKPHPALSALLNWHKSHGATTQIRNAASIASSLYKTWASKHRTKVEQMNLFFSEEDK